jgi:hypothetical protein
MEIYYPMRVQFYKDPLPFPKKLGFPLFLWFFYPLPEAEPRDKKLGFPRFYGFSDFFYFSKFL